MEDRPKCKECGTRMYPKEDLFINKPNAVLIGWDCLNCGACYSKELFRECRVIEWLERCKKDDKTKNLNS